MFVAGLLGGFRTEAGLQSSGIGGAVRDVLARGPDDARTASAAASVRSVLEYVVYAV